MCRDRWTSLDGTWSFTHDDADLGLNHRWFDPTDDRGPFTGEIQVPFPPESPASGIGARDRHPVVWYRRTVTLDRSDAQDSDRVLIHFGAVDYRARVWFDGQLVATHVGGQTPFTADVTDAIASDTDEHVLVVRAEDDPDALDQPRGKQDWRDQPHGIWYERTTGIWQTVWTETVPALHLLDLVWTPDVPAGVVRGEILLAGTPVVPVRIEVTLTLGDEVLAEVSATGRQNVVAIDAPIDALRNGQDRARLLWSPEQPTLIDVKVVLRDRESGQVIDTATSYVGLRTTTVGGGSFRLNGQPYYVRAVLNQGFRPQTHLATSGSDELRDEIILTKAMGFNAVRVHQKVEDPRFMFWADRLGLLVWAETASPYEFSSRSIDLLTTEWIARVRRDRSHPCVMVWVPINESWGVQDIATDVAQQRFAAGLADLTRALDPSRPVVSNEGWEHVDSDIFGLHDYSDDPEELRARYGDRQAVRDLSRGHAGPHGRKLVLGDRQARAVVAGDAPLMITEFGGLSLSTDKGAWGYSHAGSDSEYAALLLQLFDALRACPSVAGFCYTQLMDTGQETNGLVFADGTPKLPIDSIRHIVTGVKDRDEGPGGSTFGWAD